MLLSDGTELTFRLREHARVKVVRIAASRQAGMVVTIPRGFDRSRIPAILDRKRAWTEEALRRYPMKPAPYQPPQHIALLAFGEEWTVQYETGNPKHVTLSRRGDRLLHVTGALDRPNVVHAMLRRWLVIESRRRLVPWLLQVAGELGFAVNRVSVRAQRTIWGSCSSRNSISLNARLLLIPPDLVRYVFIHELMHMRHRNHSPAFWQDIAVYVADFREKRAELKRLWSALEI